MPSNAPSQRDGFAPFSSDKAVGRLDQILAALLDESGGEGDWGDLEPSDEELEAVAMEALKLGRLDALAALADRLGAERLAQIAPDLMERAFAMGDEDALATLITRGLLRRPKKASKRSAAMAYWDLTLRAAVGIGSVSLLSMIIENAAESRQALANASSDTGRTLLFVAPTAQVAHWLMDHGADPDARDARGETALASVLERGPSPDQFSQEPSAALALAERCELSDRAVAAMCLERSLDDPVVLKTIVERGANPDAMLSTGRPAIMEATARGFERSALLLAELGANPLATDAKGACALDLASLSGKIELARELGEISHKAKAQSAEACALYKSHARLESAPRSGLGPGI